MRQIIDFKHYTSLKIGAKIEVEILRAPQNINGNLIGGGNNLLVSPRASHLFMLGKEFDYIKDLGDLIEVGGSSYSRRIYSFFRNHNLQGLEFLKNLPGKLGGLIKMNAGMKNYEIKNILHSVCVDGEWKSINEYPFKYRDSGISGIIYGARFKKFLGFRQDLIPVFDTMRKSHPHLPSCGSCFKNPDGDFAGRLLESVGLRGVKIGDVGFSDKHANFLVNLGCGRFDDAMKLISIAQTRVFEQYGIDLEPEVAIFE